MEQKGLTDRLKQLSIRPFVLLNAITTDGPQRHHYRWASTSLLQMGLNVITTDGPQRHHYRWVSTPSPQMGLNAITTDGPQRHHYRWASTPSPQMGLNFITTDGLQRYHYRWTYHVTGRSEKPRQSARDHCPLSVTVSLLRQQTNTGSQEMVI